MSHVAEGVLRRFLDEPAAVSAMDRAHLSACPRCAGELGQAAQDRDAAAAVFMTVDGAEPEASQCRMESAWAMLVARLAEPDAPASARRTRPDGWRGQRLLRQAVHRPVAAAMIAGLIVVGGGAAAAAEGWLRIFHTEALAPVLISARDLAAIGEVGRLMALSAYGEVVEPSRTELIDVPDAGVAAARTGLTVPQVSTLPTGVEGTPHYQVLERQVAQFTFSATKAAQTAAALGVRIPPMPAGLDGSRLQLQGGPAIVMSWTQRSGVPTLIVVRMSPPNVISEGAPLPVVRDYLLSLPGIPADLAEQLRTVTRDGTTLPIPVPAALATASQVTLGDTKATVVETRDQSVAGVIWVTHGVAQAVAGPLSREEVLAVVRGLH